MTFPTCVAFEEYAVSRLQLHDGKIRDNRDDAINDLIQMYIDNFKNNKAIPQRIRDNFTREKAEKEAVADFIARTLFKGNTAQLRVALKTDTAALQAIETDLKLFEELAKDDRGLLRKVIDAIKDFIASIKGIPQFRQLEEDLNYIEQRLSRVYNSKDIKNTATDSGVVYEGNTNYYVDEIIGEDGKNYGIGVYLNSQTLDGLTDDQRIETVREHIKSLGGHSFTAFDNNGNEVKIKVAPKTKYRTENGSWERANRHLTNFVIEKEKQEALILIDEIISVATFKEREPAKHNHGWLDNNGKNEWDVWKTYIQDKENTIWEAKLKVANTTNGEKILYEIHPIEKVGPGRTMPEKPTKESIAQTGENVNPENESFFSDDLTATHRNLLDRYEQGEITKEEYLAEMDGLYGQAVERYGAIEKGEYNETDMPVPQAVAEDKPTERFARTFVGAAKLTSEMANEFEKDAIN